MINTRIEAILAILLGFALGMFLVTLSYQVEAALKRKWVAEVSNYIERCESKNFSANLYENELDLVCREGNDE